MAAVLEPVEQRQTVRPNGWRAFLGSTWRNNVRLSRNGASIVSALVIPGMFMLAFWAVFGHAASSSGFDYALFLMAASMFQAVMFTAGGSAMALAVDAESGLLSRMRAMPISAGVAIGGRIATDVLRSVLSLLTVVVLGLLCGARPDSFRGLLSAFLVALVMGVVLGLAFTGISLRSARPVQVAGLIQGVEVPVLMFSTAFIPVTTLPDWLEPVVKHMPFSPLIDTDRALLSGSAPGGTGWEALAWLGAGLILGSAWVVGAFRRKA
ncbi:MAG: ABC transporter permease [Propionibacterium acidifaciens]